MTVPQKWRYICHQSQWGMIPKSGARTVSKTLSVLTYAGMLTLAIGLFLIIRWLGSALVAPMPTSSIAASGTVANANFVARVLVALAVILMFGKALGWCLARLGQSPVIGEVLGGIILGPSLLGRIAPEISGYVLPTSIAPYLGLIAQLGIIVYMCRIGLELNGDAVRSHAYATIAISHASILVPFTLGAALALLLYPLFSTQNVSFTSFALFIGLSMSVTAFPVLARILTDSGIGATPLGTVALTCAAVDDVTAWCLLALVAGITQSSLGKAATVYLLTAAFVVALVLSRSAIRRLVFALDRQPGIDNGVAVALAGMLLSAFATELIGIHAVFGAFLFGAIIPKDSALARALAQKLEAVAGMLLPAYFAFTGMRTQIGLLSTPSQWLVFALVIVVAIVGKLGGTVAAARCCGMDWQPAFSLGILMNTRGLMELVVLNIGLDMKVLSPDLFASLVMMAIVTTLMTGPALRRVGYGAFGLRPINAPHFAGSLKVEQLRR
jgi:Kef-type K+ transport system membrane component KefB